MKFARLVLKYRVSVIISIVGLFLFSIPGILRLDITVNIKDYFIESDEAKDYQKSFEEVFGKNEFFGVLLENDDVFSPQSLEKLYEIGDSIRKNISYARSLYSIVHITSLEMGNNMFYFDEEGKLISDKAGINKTTGAFFNDPSLLGSLFSEDRKEAWVVVPLTYPENEPIPDEFELGKLVYNTISKIDCDEGMTIIPVGLSVYAWRKQQEMIDDLIKILILGALVALVLCVLIFRTSQTVIATLSLITFALVIVFGILGWLHIPAESAFISVPILLAIGVSIGNAVHINHAFRTHFNKTGIRIESIVYALDHLWKPVLFTVITTVAALMSFLSVKIYPIRWVGIVSAACIFVVYLLCMLFFPIILSIGKDKEPVIPAEKKILTYERFLDWLSTYTLKYKTLILIIFVLIALGAIIGSSKVEIDFNAEKMMGTKLEHMKDQVKIKHSDICSNEFMDLTIVGDPGWFKDSTHILHLEALQSEIDSLPLVKKTSSIVQLLRKANRLSHKRYNRFYIIPKSQKRLDYTIRQIERNNIDYLRTWTTEDYSTTRIFIEMSDFSSKTIVNNIEWIDSLVTKYFPAETEHFLTGSTYQMARMNQYITQGLINSIGVALVLITLIMMLCFKSFKLGLVAMLPNVFPVIVCGAIAGYANIPLEFVTLTVAPLILGLAVDDTIHFVSSLKTHISNFNDYEKGVKNSYKEVGIAITKTTIILFCTFLVFTISDIRSTVNMGILSCTGILAAYLADIFIVPLLIKWVRSF